LKKSDNNNKKNNNIKDRIFRIAYTLIMVLIVAFAVSKFDNNDTNTSNNKKSVNTTVSPSSTPLKETFIGEATEEKDYKFRKEKYKKEHFEKHGKDMGFSNADDYEAAASEVVNNPNSLYKTEKEDGDNVYYLEESNEFVIVSTDGYIRTYFNPEKGKKYFESQ
jgi:pyocin large subunit-like protein